MEDAGGVVRDPTLSPDKKKSRKVARKERKKEKKSKRKEREAARESSGMEALEVTPPYILWGGTYNDNHHRCRPSHL